MDNNKVQNPQQTIKPNENQYNDRDKLNDCLMSVKHLKTMYGMLEQEASNQNLLTALEPLCTALKNLERSMFDLMFTNGWYALTKEETNKINQTHMQFTQKLQQLQ